MNPIRLGQVLALSATLALTACGASGTPAPAPAARGAVQATVLAAPGAVQAILVTVTSWDIPGDYRTTLTQDVNGHWTGTVLEVPPGTATRTVTAYAYDSTAVPAQPDLDVTGLIYRGQTSGLSVVGGATVQVTLHLTPYPDGSGGIGLNTPPHLVGITHPDWIAANATAALTATALDPDLDAVLTYTWSDGGAGGTFTGGAGNPAVNLATGVAAAVGYVPPHDFLGQVTLTLDVTDGTAHATSGFKLAVGSGVAPVIVFDVLPDITLSAAQSQELQLGGTTTIDWSLTYPAGAGPDALQDLHVWAEWTDSCGGAFDVPSGNFMVNQAQPISGQVTYTAGAGGAQPCDLRLTVSDVSGAREWSRLYVWVAPVTDVHGFWEGHVTDPAIDWQGYELELSLQQAGSQVTGTYAVSNAYTWGFTGTFAAPQIAFELQATTPNCTGTLPGTATLVGPDTMDVSYDGIMHCGSGDSAGDVPVAGSATLARMPTKVVFVTSAAHDGNLGGRAGADAFCQQAADASNLVPAGTYKAYLSIGGAGAYDRLSVARYVLPDGTLVVNRTGALQIPGLPLQSEIYMDENGVPREALVWTGSDLVGQPTDQPDGNCNDWSDATIHEGVTGETTQTGPRWLDATSGSCSQAYHLYCFQQ
jgi:hypothetical protein